MGTVGIMMIMRVRDGDGDGDVHIRMEGRDAHGGPAAVERGRVPILHAGPCVCGVGLGVFLVYVCPLEREKRRHFIVGQLFSSPLLPRDIGRHLEWIFLFRSHRHPATESKQCRM